MAEEDNHGAHSGEGHPERGGEGHEKAPEHAKKDPMEHILDRALFGIDATTGQLTWIKRDKEGEPLAYAPMTVGPKMFPIRLEFTKHMLTLTVVAVLFYIAAIAVAKRVLAGLHANTAPKGPLANAFEAIIVFVRDELVVPIGGHHLGHYTPLFLNYFLFILFCNLVGMFPLPFLGTATGNISVTLAMGGSIYALVWLLGMYNQGPFNYLLHLVPPGTPWWLWPLMFVLELMGPAIKCFVLCIRLFANMIAGHLIVGTVLGLGTFGVGAPLTAGLAVMMLAFGVPLALGVSTLELLVCFIQAYVFTLLAIIFIGAAMHPEH